MGGFNRIHTGKVIAIAVTVLLVGLLAFFLWQSYREEKEQETRNEQMEQELRPLYQEKARLRQELEDLIEGHGGMGSLILLFTNLDETIYTEIYPQMETYEYTGVLALSPERLPGQSGCMSRQQFEELLEKGWECCLVWDENEDAEKWLKANRELERKVGISKLKTVYFLADSYSSEADAFLEREGFSVAVHHGEEGRPIIATDVEEVIWYPGAIPWSQNNAVEMLSDAMIQRGNLVFTVGSGLNEEAYDKDRFASMLGAVSEYCLSDRLFVTDFSGAAEYQRTLHGNDAAREAEMEDRRAELERRIEELDMQMNAIVDKYAK